MRTVFSFAALLAWGLWLGGLTTLLIFMYVLFGRDRAVAEKAAPILFLTFERFELIVGAAAMVATVGWRLSHRHSLVTLLFVLFLLSTAAAAGKHLLLTPKMEELRQRGESKGDEYRGLHQASSIIYVTQAGVLLIAGLMLPSILRRDVAPKEAPVVGTSLE